MTEYKLRFSQKIVVMATQSGMSMTVPRSINLHRLLDYYDAEDGPIEVRFIPQDDRDCGCGKTPFYSVLKLSVPYGTKVALDRLVSFLRIPKSKGVRTVIKTAQSNARRADEHLFCEDGYVWLRRREDIEREEQEDERAERGHHTLDDVIDFT